MRRLGKWLKWIALGLCVLLVAILVSTEAVLNTPWSRNLLRDQIQKLAGPALNARLEIDSVDSISLSHARVSGVRLFDRRDRLVASVGRADVTINAWALMAKRLRLPTLSVWNAYVDLGAPGEEGGGGLLGLLAENSTTKEPSAEDEGGLHIDMPRVRLAHSQVDVKLGENRLSAREIDTDVGVDVADEVAIDVRKLGCDLLRDQHALATVQRVKGQWASTGAAKAALDMVFATGATLNANAELGAEHQVDGQAEQSLLADVQAHGVTAQTLAQLGVDAEWLTNKADTTVKLKGTTRGFDYAIDLEAAPMATARASGHATLPSPAKQTAKLLLAIERGQYQGTQLPRVDAGARWNAKHGVAIEHFKAVYPKTELTAHGQVSPNGAVALIAHLESSALDEVPPLHDAVPNLSGALDADIDFTRGDGGAMQAKVQLGLKRPALGETRADRIAITGLVHGSSADDVRGNLQIDATAVHAGQVDVPHATIAIAGSPRRAAANGRFGDKGHFDLTVERNDSVITGDANAHLVVDGKGNVLHAVVRGLRYDKNGAVSVQRAAARYQNAHLELAGLFDPKRESKLALSLDATNLQPVTAAWVETPLVGEVHLDVDARGTLQKPHVQVDAGYENDTMLGDRHMPTHVKFSGEFNLDNEKPKAPVFETRFDSQLLFRNDLGPLKLAVLAKYADSQVDLKLDAQDSRGPLVRTHVQTGFEHTGFKSDASGLSKLLAERAWQVELWIGARRIDELPGVRSIDVPKVVWPAKISVDAKFAHEPGKEPEGKLTANLVWDPPGREEGVITCGMARRPELQVAVDMRNGELHAQLDASVDKRQMLTVGTDSKAPIDEWLQASVAKVQPASVYVEFKDLRLQDLPVVCEHATGYVTGRANLKRALLDKVESEIDLHAREVTFVGAPPFDAEIAGRADRQMLIGSAKLHAKNGDATVAAKLPLDGSGRLPTLSFDEPAQVDINLRHIDARALLGAVSAVRTSGGEFKGQIGMRGNLSSPTFQGTLEMKDVSVTLAEAGQRFERVTGKVALDGRHLHLYPTIVHDRDGSVEVTGDATVIDLTSWQAELTAKAKRFRVRRSGVILALFDGKVGLTATVDPKETTMDVTIDDARVELTGESMSAVQALDPHEDIEFVDDLPQPEKLKQETRRATPVILTIVSKSPFWIRREDFSALVSTQLRIEVRDGNSNLSGPVDIERGYVELMGQMFDIEQGRIQFTGGRNVEPTLDLVAKRRRPGGQTVTIKASGPLYDPQLTFMIEGQTVTAGEALAEATGAAPGTGNGVEVQNQVSSMATGIAGSVLTLGARRELGDWVPVLALEQSGPSTRVRAGVEAGRFIPKFLRKVVVDAYVEGIIQSTDTTDQPNATAARSESAVQAEPGVLLELRFPRHLVGEAQYGPGEVWSLDLSWQP